MSTPRLLLVDDDEAFRERLAVAMKRRGYETLTAPSASEALSLAPAFGPTAAVVDLKMPEENGLVLVKALKERYPGIAVIVLTGYGSIATALEAVRLGAADYLTKPADADRVHEALQGKVATPEAPLPPVETPTLDRVEWEHMQRILSDCGHNISQAARVLGIDRRSLQRKLAKYPPAK
ncbi:MAG TPA: response regulator [Candidatus Methylacidiphilales bacterium]